MKHVKSSLVFLSADCEPTVEKGKAVWILGWGGAASHTEGEWDIYRFDGSWWCEGGTEICTSDQVPKFWAYLSDVNTAVFR